MITAIIGTAVLVISITAGILLAGHNAVDRPRQTRVLLFVLYFWLLTFSQLIVVAIGYSLLAR